MAAHQYRQKYALNAFQYTANFLRPMSENKQTNKLRGP
jgi:hypothetical protein